MPLDIDSSASHVLPRTDAAIKKLDLPAGRKEAIFWHAALGGLGLRIRAGGSRSWILQFRNAAGQTRRLTLGKAPAVSLSAAEKAARARLGELALGHDPAAKRDATKQEARAALPCSDLFERYLSFVGPQLKPGTLDQYQRNLRLYLKPLHRYLVGSLTIKEIVSALDQIAEESGLSQSNRCRSTLAACLRWAAGRGEASAEIAFAVRLVPRHKEKARERVLKPEEIGAIWRATAEPSAFNRLARCLLLSGCRRGELAGLQWEEIGPDWIIVPAERMKAKSEHRIALLPALLEALPPRPEEATGFVFGQNGSPFSGWNAALKRLRKRVDSQFEKPIAAWSLHDFRRSLSSHMADRTAVPPRHVEALLAHTIQGVEQVYNRAELLEQRKAALAEWHKLVEGFIAKAGDKSKN